MGVVANVMLWVVLLNPNLRSLSKPESSGLGTRCDRIVGQLVLIKDSR